KDRLNRYLHLHCSFSLFPLPALTDTFHLEGRTRTQRILAASSRAEVALRGRDSPPSCREQSSGEPSRHSPGRWLGVPPRSACLGSGRLTRQADPRPSTCWEKQAAWSNNPCDARPNRQLGKTTSPAVDVGNIPIGLVIVNVPVGCNSLADSFLALDADRSSWFHSTQRDQH